MDKHAVMHKLEKAVEEVCGADSAAKGPDYLKEYIFLGRDYAFGLARILGADEFVIEASALSREIVTARGESLATMGLDQVTIGRIEECLLHEKKPVWRGEASAEAVCLSNGMAMAAIARPALWLRHAFLVKGMGYKDGCRWLLDWYEGLWNSLIDEALTISAADYRAARRILAGASGLPGAAELEATE